MVARRSTPLTTGGRRASQMIWATPWMTQDVAQGQSAHHAEPPGSNDVMCTLRGRADTTNESDSGDGPRTESKKSTKGAGEPQGGHTHVPRRPRRRGEVGNVLKRVDQGAERKHVQSSITTDGNDKRDVRVVKDVQAEEPQNHLHHPTDPCNDLTNPRASSLRGRRSQWQAATTHVQEMKQGERARR